MRKTANSKICQLTVTEIPLDATLTWHIKGKASYPWYRQDHCKVAFRGFLTKTFKLSGATGCTARDIELNWIELNWIELNWMSPFHFPLNSYTPTDVMIALRKQYLSGWVVLSLWSLSFLRGFWQQGSSYSPTAPSRISWLSWQFYSLWKKKQAKTHE